MEIFWLQITTSVVITILTTGNIMGKEVKRSQEAVTSLIGLEDFYVQIRNRRPFTYLQGRPLGPLQEEDYMYRGINYDQYRGLPPPKPADQRIPNEISEKEDLQDKDFICARITASPMFELYGEETVRFGPDSTDSDQRINQQFEMEMQKSGGLWMNPYEKMTVVVENDKFDEYVFRCMTRKKESDEYITYFVSPVYHLFNWDSANEEDRFIMDGRFLFTRNEQQELKVFARAEEPAIVYNDVIQWTLEAHYYSRRHGIPEPDVTNNKVCMLSVPDKIRLCSVIFNTRTDRFSDNVKFLPSEDNIEPECDKKKVVAVVKLGEKFKVNRSLPEEDEVPENVEIMYDEWMYGCKVHHQTPTSEPSNVSTYHVSHSRVIPGVIVFEHIGNDIYSPYVGLIHVRLLEETAPYKIILHKPINYK